MPCISAPTYVQLPFGSPRNRSRAQQHLHTRSPVSLRGAMSFRDGYRVESSLVTVEQALLPIGFAPCDRRFRSTIAAQIGAYAISSSVALIFMAATMLAPALRMSCELKRDERLIFYDEHSAAPQRVDLCNTP